jgi:hypothetical protein
MNLATLFTCPQSTMCIVDRGGARGGEGSMR